MSNIPGTTDNDDNVNNISDNDIETTETIVADSWGKRFLYFWLGCSIRIIENLLSIKVWFLLLIFFYSSYLLVRGHIQSNDWCTLNGICVSVVLGMREIYKVGSIISVKDLGQLKKSFPKIPKIK